MEYKVLYASRYYRFTIVFLVLIFTGCKSSQNLSTEPSETTSEETRTAQEERTSTVPSDEPNPDAILVTYKNRSSNIQLKLDPSKDQFYMDLSGMTPQEKDSVIVKDSTLIQNRAVDIQTLLTSFRKAQDLFYVAEYKDALAEIDKTIEIQETADAYALKGTIFFMMENITAARANWNKAVQMDPNIPVPSIPELETLIEDIRGQDN